CANVLERELGVEPEAETKAVYQEILRRREAPVARVEEAASGTSPPGPLSPPIVAGLAAPSADTPLIGREREMARLRGALEEAWGGRGRVVALLGEAGVGKSRLVGQLAEDAVERGGCVLVGRAHENQEILAFGPWVDALRGGQATHKTAGLRSVVPIW